MSSPSDRGPRMAPAAWLTAAAVCLLASMVPPPAWPGINGPTGIGPTAAVPTPADAEPKILERQAGRAGQSEGTYQLRCWQQGRLVFEENGVRVDFEGGRYGARLKGTDRQGDTIVVADTHNATCLIRAERPTPQLPRRD